jgi:TolA-binding protein
MDTREGIALQNQILELRRDLQSMQSQAGRGAAPGGSSFLAPRSLAPPPAAGGGGGDLTTQLLERVQALEEQVRALRGQLDEVTNTTQRQNAELSKQVGDLNFALQGGGGRPLSGSAPFTPSAPPPTSPPPSILGTVPAPAPPSPPTGGGRRTPEVALQEGYVALSRHDYATAEAAAREVLAGSRTSPRAYDAQYVLAQSLAGQRNYAQAAIAFDDTYNRSRTGSHAPEALLGLANALTSIGEKRAACDTLAKLGAEFPRLHGDVRDGANVTLQRAGCH